MIQVVYADEMNAQDTDIYSPSARKPRILAERIRRCSYDVQWVAPIRLEREDFYLCHDPTHVDDILDGRKENGFNTISPSISRMLPYTSGAMYKAALIATPQSPSVAFVSGFHHADYDLAQMFCTFNGLMVTALKLLQSKRCEKIAIIDCDYHYGNGTDSILDRLGMHDRIFHYSFGKFFKRPSQAHDYLAAFVGVQDKLYKIKPDVILYQAGADVHINDPLGGILDNQQIYLRDEKMFTIAKNLHIPLAWNLAGGYQVDEHNDLSKVIDIHELAFQACENVYRDCRHVPLL